MKVFPILSPTLLAGLLAVSVAPARAASNPAAVPEPTASAAASEVSTIKFSDPSKPGTLKLNIAQGDVHIRGTDAPAVTVHSEIKPEPTTPRKDGLRVLTASSSYSLAEKDNVATLVYGTAGWPAGGGIFDITVPRSTSIVISNSLGGDITIGGVTGNLEIKSLNGEVKLSDVAGGALVETMNGEIAVDVRQLVEGKPLSFSSMNGKVQLHLPADAKASVRLRTHNGSIMTDFDEKQLVTKTASLGGEGGRHFAYGDSGEIRAAVRDAMRIGMEAAREATRAAREAVREGRAASSDNDVDVEIPEPPVPPMAPLPPMTGGKIVTGTLNGGGPEIRITTMNGDVVLRKSAPAKS